MQTTPSQTTPSPWRLQDAKAQFSALVDNAIRGVPQHVTRRGKPAVVVLSEQDFKALQPDDVTFAKSAQEDLTPDQIKLLAQFMKDITHG